MNCRGKAPGPVEMCPTVRQRQAFDRGRGKTTSHKAIDFIRRTCPYEHCAAARARP